MKKNNTLKPANYQKLLTPLPVIILFVTHSIFLLFIIFEKENPWYIGLAHTVFILSVLLAYLYLFRRKDKISNFSWSLSLGVLGGALLTGILNIELGLGGVIASAVVGLVGVLIKKIFKNSSALLAPAIYCGSFIGMTKGFVEPYYLILSLAGIISGLFFSISQFWFQGFGGKLGSIAFVGMLFSLLLHYFLW